MITDEMVEWAAEAIWQSEPVRSGGRRRTLWPDESDETRGRYWPLARAALEAVLPMIRAEVLEECAKWHDAEAKRWNVELWERRSWGGPTIGEGECLEHIKAHEHSATTIRAMKGGET